MAIELTTKFSPHVDEMFTAESKKDLITNQDYEWSGAHSIKVYKVNTVEMNDYDRNGAKGGASRYGEVKDLDAITEEMTLKRDRSFTFVIDRLDEDETQQAVSAASALARQMRQVIIPEVDQYTYGIMCENAGLQPEATEITAENIYTMIVEGNKALDNNLVPETGRNIIVTPDIYTVMKKCPDITMETDIGNDLRLKGVIATIDGCNVIKVPAVRLPEDFGFMICHPVATVAPTKLESYKTHVDPPGINGSLVEGRICYDAFVLDNKATAIYYQRRA